jgi:hypothetical protein
MQNPLTKSVSPRAAAISVGVGLLVLLGVWYGPSAFRKLTNRPESAQDVGKNIWKYLAKRSGEKEFAVDLSAVTNGVSEAAPEATAPLRKRNRRPLPAQAGYAKYFQQKQAEASTYKALYKLVGQELKLGESLLQSADEKQAGVALIMDASRCATSPTEDPWLAARICEGFIWPEVEKNEKANASAEQLLSFCENVFRDAGETNNVIRNYRMLIAKAQGSQVDITRFRLSRVLQDAGQYREALACLQQMSNTNKNGYKQRVAFLQEKIKASGN